MFRFDNPDFRTDRVVSDKSFINDVDDAVRIFLLVLRVFMFEGKKESDERRKCSIEERGIETVMLAD